MQPMPSNKNRRRNRGRNRPVVPIKPISLLFATTLFPLFAAESALLGQEGDQVTRNAAAIPFERYMLESVDIHESSGLAPSLLHPHLLYTHNDSGDSARIFGIDRYGKPRGEWELPGVIATDWEDMCALRWRGAPHLLLADVGDNRANRHTCQLHIVREPHGPAAQLQLVRTLEFQYEDGPHDCEAVAFDPLHNTVLLVAKRLPARSTVYRLTLDNRSDQLVATARQLTTLAIPLVTSLDISMDGRQCVAATYGAIYRYVREHGEAWDVAFRRSPERFIAPPRRQGEAVCFSLDGRYLFLTSEKRPTPLIRLGPLPAPPRRTTQSGRP